MSEPYDVYRDYGVNVTVALTESIAELAIAHEAESSRFISVIVMYTMSTVVFSHLL